MKVIPAIDIIDGKCVRLSQGDYTQKTEYHTDPLAVARSFEEAGLRHLHLVDLDGAKAGKVVNLAVLEKISRETSLVVDFGGGVKSEQDLEDVLKAGATQVNCGSIAVKNPEEFTRWISRYGSEKFILSADVRDRKVAISGWMEASSVDILDFISLWKKAGIRHVTCTDIATDGMLSGPNIELYEDLRTHFPDIHLIASGGVSSLDDLVALKEIGMYGAITGKAIYEGKINLNEIAVLSR
jgi:phosphoribosylformimino-5-aminoimidazole carboxamide ribotide isomerase